MRKYQFNVNKDVVSYLERCHWEYETSKDNVAFLLEKNTDNPTFLDSDIFRAYEQRQTEKKIACDTAKEELFRRFVPEQLKQHQIEWSLDFRMCVLTVIQKCDCEVKL